MHSATRGEEFVLYETVASGLGLYASAFSAVWIAVRSRTIPWHHPWYSPLIRFLSFGGSLRND